MIIKYESNLTFIKKIEKIDTSLFPDVYFKRANLISLNKVPNFNLIYDQIKNIPRKDKKYLNFDLKIKNVKKGVYPSISGWHCDTLDVFKENNDRFFIFVNDKNCLTEFIIDPMELEINQSLSTEKQMAFFQQQIKEINPRIMKIEPWTLYEYSSKSFHRVSLPLKNHRRLLLRINESDSMSNESNNLPGFYEK